MRKKFLSLCFFAFSCLILSGVVINSVVAVTPNIYNGTGESKKFATTGTCAKNVFPKGQTYCLFYNGEQITIRVSLYYFPGNGTRSLIGNPVYYSQASSSGILDETVKGAIDKTSVVEKILDLGTITGTDFSATTYNSLSSQLNSYFLNSNGNYSNFINLLSNMSVDIKKLTRDSQPANRNRAAIKGYRIIIEPMVAMIDKNGNRYLYSVKELANIREKPTEKPIFVSTWRNRGLSNYLTTEFKDVGINAGSDCTITSGERQEIYDKVAPANTGCGYNIIDVTNPIKVNTKRCDINVNNNTGDDAKYNWTYWDANCDADGDGTKEGCWKKQKDGCCDQVDLTDEILNIYPECASCTPSNKTYVNGKDVSSLNAISCDANNKKITNYRGTGSLNETTPKYCLANNNLLVGSINGKRYGCEITDSLLLPKEYGNSLKIGQYFVWPTSKTLQKLGNFDMRYPVTRASNVTCVAYQYTSDGKLQYVNLTTDELKTLKKRFKVSGDLNLTFNSNNNGKIVEESQNYDFKNIDNNLFTGNINTVYTLEKVNKTNGVYAYYDQEKLQYTNSIIVQKINKYIQYGFPIIPFGNYGDTRVNINYGINFENMGLSRLNAYSGSYICSKSGKDKNNKEEPTYCKCESGTVHEGLDLTPYFNKTYDSWTAECARIRDLKCNDPNTPIKCPNDDSKDMTNCVKNKLYGGANEKEAYDLCVAHDCGCTGNLCTPGYCKGDKCGLDIIYRPIFLNNPFPSIRATKRVAGANWGGKNSLNIDGLGTKYITSTARKMYQGEPMYSFTLTPKALNVIKKYNINHGYDNFDMTCGKNQYCISNVLRGAFSEYFTGGTCQLQTNAKVRGNKDCRLTALER